MTRNNKFSRTYHRHRAVLSQHYLGLVKRVLLKLAVLTFGLTHLLIPGMAAAAGQLTARSTTVSTSAAGATTATYAIKFTFATAGQTVGSFKLEMCDSPLPNGGTCNNTAGTSGAAGSSGATFTSVTAASVAVNTGTWTNAGTCTLGTHSGNSMIVQCTAGTITATPTVTITLSNVTNPTNANRNYSVHVSSYTDTSATTPAYPGTDYGAMALSTTQAMTATAKVQESLVFCTGTSGGGSSDCTTISGATVNIGTGTDNVLSSTQGSGATSLMYISTNAASGYTISYTTTSAAASGAFAKDASTTFNSASTQTLATCTSGNVSCFGINLAANTTTSTPAGAIGAAISGGSGTPAATAGYATADSFKFVPGATAQSIVTQGTPGPTGKTTITVSYVAQAGLTTPPGGYAAVFNYVATGTF